MPASILFDVKQDKACLFDSERERVFGPVFSQSVCGTWDAEQQAQRFLDWLGEDIDPCQGRGSEVYGWFEEWDRLKPYWSADDDARTGGALRPQCLIEEAEERARTQGLDEVEFISDLSFSERMEIEIENILTKEGPWQIKAKVAA